MQQHIKDEIIKLIDVLRPNHGEKMIFSGSCYSGYSSGGFYWYVDGERKGYGFKKRPDEVNQIMAILQENLNNEHFLITAHKSGDIDFQIKYIPEEDDWVNMPMQRISELTEEQLKETGVPKEVWEDRKRLFSLPEHETYTEILVRTLLNQFVQGDTKLTMSYDLQNIVMTKYTEDGSVNPITVSDSLRNKIIDTCNRIRESDIYKKTPWSKLSIEVNTDMTFNIDFGYDD